MLFGEIFGPDLFVALFVPILLLALLGISIWALVDVSSHSKEDFYSAGSSKVAWIIVIALLTVFYGLGSLIAIYYFLAVRPKVLTVEALSAEARRRGSDPRATGAHRYCSQCGASLRTASNFCAACGVAVLA